MASQNPTGPTGAIQYSQNGSNLFGGMQELYFDSASKSVSIGFSSKVVSSTKGLSTAGVVGICSTGATQASLYVTNYQNYPYAIQINGTFTGSSQIGIYSLPTFSCSTGTTEVIGIRNVPQFSLTSNSTIANCMGLYINNRISSASSSGTITTVYGEYIDTGTAGGSTVINNAYGLYVKRPILATTDNYTAFFESPLCVGSSQTNSAFTVFPTSGSKHNYAINVFGTLQNADSSSNLIGFQNAPTLNCTGSNTSSIGFSNYTTIKVPSGKTTTNAIGLYSYLDMTATTGSCTNSFSCFLADGTATTASGSVTNAYGLYCLTPAFGINKYCGYFQGGVGIGTTPPTSAGLYLPTSGGTPSNLNYYEEYTFTSNYSGPFNSTSFDIQIIRCGKMVTLLIPAIGHAGNLTDGIVTNATTIPTRFRPVSSQVYNLCIVAQNGTILTTPGMLVISTSGDVLIYKDVNSSTFTASSGYQGMNYGTSISYTVS